MKTILLFFTGTVIIINCLPQTNVSGGIYSNTTWIKANSPYIVTGDIVVFPDKTLTIEPGVEVKFDGYFYFEVRGKLVAIGTVTDSIKFVSNISNSKSSWYRILLKGNQNGFGIFKYCIVKHSNGGLAFESVIDSSLVENSFFENNFESLSNYWGWNMPVTNCLFTNNQFAVGGGVVNIDNCFFENNSSTVSLQNLNVHNSVFQNNGTALNSGNAAGIIENCIMTNNNVGINFYSSGGGVVENNIIKNNNIGIRTTHYSSTYNGIQYYIPIKNNQICNNSTYNVENLNSDSKNITQNCFCIDDSTEIENKLFDGYDDITKGLFNYDIYDTACLNIIQSVYKVGSPPSSAISITENNLFSSFPNPVSENLTVVFNNRINTNSEINLYNSTGEKIIYTIHRENGILNINLNEFPNGLYLIEIKSDDVVKKEKVIKI